MTIFKKLDSSLKDKKQRKKLVVGSFVLLFAIIGSVIILQSFAAAPEMYISPATSNVTTGSDVTVTIRVNPGTAINAVDATITFDKTKLQFKSIDSSASAFALEGSATGSNTTGTVNVARAISGGTVTSDVEVAKVTFTAISTASASTSLQLTGSAVNAGTAVTLSYTGSTISITGSSVPNTSQATYTIEPTVAAPINGTQFGLKVYVTSSDVFKGGEVVVNLPAGLAYQGTLDTTGTAFNPATTVTGTTAQLVHLVFVTQSTTLTGKQLVATIPVMASTTGAKSVTFSGAQVADINNANMATITANPFTITVNSASLPAPVVTLPGSSAIGSSTTVTDLKQSFAISNFDNTATYTITLGGQNIPVSNGSFSIPSSIKNGDLTLQVAVTKNGASGNTTATIRLRSPNVNRTGCVDLQDLLVVNDGYGKASTELDLNFDGTVSLIDLLTVTGKWGGDCI